MDVEDAEEEVVHVSLSTAEPLGSLKDFHLIFCHLEAVVKNKRERKIFKTTESQRRSQAVVVDRVCRGTVPSTNSAHFVVDW